MLALLRKNLYWRLLKVVENKFSIWYINNVRYVNKNEIDEGDIPDEDVEKLVELYEKETDKLKADTEKIKNHIRQMLKQLQKTKRCDIK